MESDNMPDGGTSTGEGDGLDAAFVEAFSEWEKSGFGISCREAVGMPGWVAIMRGNCVVAMAPESVSDDVARAIRFFSGFHDDEDTWGPWFIDDAAHVGDLVVAMHEISRKADVIQCISELKTKMLTGMRAENDDMRRRVADVEEQMRKNIRMVVSTVFAIDAEYKRLAEEDRVPPTAGQA